VYADPIEENVADATADVVSVAVPGAENVVVPTACIAEEGMTKSPRAEN
jgi:hypothetical protein